MTEEIRRQIERILAAGYRAQLTRHLTALAEACEGEEVVVHVERANRTTLRWSVRYDELAPLSAAA